MTISDWTAEAVIGELGLQPHPEGGFYRETFRDPCVGQARASSTAIYFLLPAGQVSHWHRVDAAEVWHFYAGAPLLLEHVAKDAKRSLLRLGLDLPAGERPQGIVPAWHWQTARSLGAWSLVGCTVAPGFEFTGFELAPAGWRPV